MSNTPTQAVVKTEEKFIELVPFGGEDKIRITINQVKNLIAVKTKSGKTCSDTDAIKFMALCQARRLNPYEGDCFLIGYDGKDGVPSFSLITAHQAFLKRAELNQEYDGMKSGVIVDEGTPPVLRDLEGDFYTEGSQRVVGGWATVFFKNRKQHMHKRVRLKRFQKAWGIWQEDPAGMIVKCAEADALRSSFPTMLGGLYMKEEVEGQTEVKTSTPIFSSPTPTVDITPAKVEEPPKPASVTKSQPTQVIEVAERCAKAKITEAQLLEFMMAIGIAEEGCQTLEEAHAKNDTALAMVVENWADFSERIKS